MSQSISRPAPLRFAAAALTAATATLLLLQLMREDRLTREAWPNEPPPVLARAASTPEVGPIPTFSHPVIVPKDTVLPPIAPAVAAAEPMRPATSPSSRSSTRRNAPSKLRGFLPVKDFGGY